MPIDQCSGLMVQYRLSANGVQLGFENKCLVRFLSHLSSEPIERTYCIAFSLQVQVISAL